MWWAHSSNKYARSAKPPLAGGHLEKLLAAGEWEDPYPYDKSAARSMMAWRGLWAGPDLGLVNEALDRNLAPPPTHLDWWAREYFRGKALKALFLPTWPVPSQGSPVSRWDQYEREEALRKEVARKLHDRYPTLVSWFVGSSAPRSLYSHPLIIAARPGYEEEFERIASVVDLGRLFEKPEPLVYPGQDQPVERPPLATPATLLEIGLKRRFSPLVDMALASGAKVSDPVFDFKGHERSLLHMAIASADPDTIDWVLERGPDLEAWDRLARTPFLAAARQADVKTMEKLAAAGADVHAVDRFGQTAAHLAIEGISTQAFNHQAYRAHGAREYTPKDPHEIDLGLTRAAQALVCIERLGVDIDKPCASPPRVPKGQVSPYAGLPRAARQKGSAKAKETWSDQMERRCQDDVFLGERGMAFLREVQMDLALPLVPPQPEDGEEGAEPMVTPRPKARF